MLFLNLLMLTLLVMLLARGTNVAWHSIFDNPYKKEQDCIIYS